MSEKSFLEEVEESKRTVKKAHFENMESLKSKINVSKCRAAYIKAYGERFDEGYIPEECKAKSPYYRGLPDYDFNSGEFAQRHPHYSVNCVYTGGYPNSLKVPAHRCTVVLSSSKFQ